jgi:starch phosphorylase
VILQNIPREHLGELSRSARFRDELRRLESARLHYLSEPTWYAQTHPSGPLARVAYFSMEFGLGSALPLYAGGLGVLAGDYIKASSDLGIPMAAVGLLYQEGYFRQMLDAEGMQHETYPCNDATSLPLQPVLSQSGGWLRIQLEFPGRTLHLRAWKAKVGRVDLFLLDSNEALNSPADRGITSKLYGGGMELRFMQEIILGIGGWRLLDALGLEVDVCHLNDGHPAFVVLERARSFMRSSGLPFWEALWATRAGNVFTTHTSVGAGFDNFPASFVSKYFSRAGNYLAELGIPIHELLALGRKSANDPEEPFKMAFLAMRGCSLTNGVSRLHGKVSRRVFRDLFPRWPESEIPITHITNGVHVPSWDSRWADEAWTRACGKGRWRKMVDLADSIQCLSDEEIWALNSREREDLVRCARERLVLQLGQRGAEPQAIVQAREVLDPRALTLGFARRFSEYKRPGLLLRYKDRLVRILTDPERPVQLIVAGKAHPADEEGKRLIQAWAAFASEPAVRKRVVFLEDYDISLAQDLVQGVDVWINTPRRPWEASGTSGMKALVNGGLNLSELDGWWDEAYSPDVGWAIGDGQEHADPGWDNVEAWQLCDILEKDIVPEFYHRDGSGIPRAWIARIRASMTKLAPFFSANRMAQQYVEEMYLPAARSLKRREEKRGDLARKLRAWQVGLEERWPGVRFGDVRIDKAGEEWQFFVEVHLAGFDPDVLRVELFAEAVPDGEPLKVVMERTKSLAAPHTGYLYTAKVPSSRPAVDYTPRIVPWHAEVRVPAEEAHILWLR